MGKCFSIGLPHIVNSPMPSNVPTVQSQQDKERRACIVSVGLLYIEISDG